MRVTDKLAYAGSSIVRMTLRAPSHLAKVDGRIIGVTMMAVFVVVASLFHMVMLGKGIVAAVGGWSNVFTMDTILRIGPTVALVDFLAAGSFMISYLAVRSVIAIVERERI